MLALRRARASLCTGGMAFLDAPEGVLAFRRGPDTLCVFNMGDGAAEWQIPAGETLLHQGATREAEALHLAPTGFLIAATG